jgi:hypothetical protein
VVLALNCAPDVPGQVNEVAVLGLKATTGRDPPDEPVATAIVPFWHV